jgi:hypothetical protein
VTAFPPGTLSSKAALLRPAARALAGWPGEILLTPLGEDCGWLREACPHRRWIAVAGRKSAKKARAAALSAGAAVVAPEGGSVILEEDGRRDCLILGERAPPEDLVWAMAAMLGLGFAPRDLACLTSLPEAPDAVGR